MKKPSNWRELNITQLEQAIRNLEKWNSNPMLPDYTKERVFMEELMPLINRREQLIARQKEALKAEAQTSKQLLHIEHLISEKELNVHALRQGIETLSFYAEQLIAERSKHGKEKTH